MLSLSNQNGIIILDKYYKFFFIFRFLIPQRESKMLIKWTNLTVTLVYKFLKTIKKGN
jgi:hypothetical protein